MVIVQQLTRILPERYVAEPRVHLGTEVEVDIAAFDRDHHRRSSITDREEVGVSTAWESSEPTLAIQTDLADTDEYEVRVYDVEHERRLVAAVELISPRNKDRPESRQQFVAKCIALLRQHVSLVLVDLVTARDFNLYAELLESVGEYDTALGDHPLSIYAASCRWRPLEAVDWLEAWYRPLEIDKPLPGLPLWLSDELAIPLNLEASYEQTCRDLRIA